LIKYYRPTLGDQNFGRIYDLICKDLVRAPAVDTGHWQAKKDTPMTQTREIQNAIIEFPIAATPGAWASFVQPNLPWAEDHFNERVSGKPLNPPPSHVDWPYNQQGNKDHMDGKVFSHSYPERMWPRNAPESNQESKVPNVGIRYEYGDLNNAVDLLVQEPTTRQCYIPIWFPEDLHASAVEHQRVPCTLGYHAMLRRGVLNIFYPMRSTDAVRYLKDDAYMAGRLTHWLIEKCQKQSAENSIWHDVYPGTLTIHTASLHCFVGDIPNLSKLAHEKAERKVLT
jgi:hypothetical protein